MTTPAQTLLFICLVAGLGTAFALMLWDLEQRAKARVSKVGATTAVRSRDRRSRERN